MFREFFDQLLMAIEDGRSAFAIDALDEFFKNTGNDKVLEALREHRLCEVLLSDPFLNSAGRPSARSENPDWLNCAYDCRAESFADDLAATIFDATTSTSFADTLRCRREIVSKIVMRAWAQGQRICALDCGYFREGDKLIGRNLTTMTLVDRNPEFLAALDKKLGQAVVLECDSPAAFLRKSARAGEKFDLIYSIGMAGASNTTELSCLLAGAASCLTKGGAIMLVPLIRAPVVLCWTGLMAPDAAPCQGPAIDIRVCAAGLNCRSHITPDGCAAFHEFRKDPADPACIIPLH